MGILKKLVSKDKDDLPVIDPSDYSIYRCPFCNNKIVDPNEPDFGRDLECFICQERFYYCWLCSGYDCYCHLGRGR